MNNCTVCGAHEEHFDGGSCVQYLLARIAELEAERDEARAENDQLRELLNVYNLGGWMDSERLIKERDALKRECEQAMEWLATIASADGSGHGDLAERLRLNLAQHGIPPALSPAEPEENGPESERHSETEECEDCPPPDYPTDETRCAPCPRRRSPAPTEDETSDAGAGR